MSDDSILNRYAPQKPEESQDIVGEAFEDDDSDETRYRAFRMGKMGRGETRLKLYHQNGVISLMTYAYLVEAVCASHRGIALIFTNCVIQLNGRNLTPLLDLLQDSKIRSLHCFDARNYPEPEAHEPKIVQIVRQTLQDAMLDIHHKIDA